MKRTVPFALICALIAISISSCERGVNFFSVSQDMEFGETLQQEVENNSTEYPILDRAQNPEAYAYLDGMMTDILKSDEFKFHDRFDWEVTIINKDVKNAFAAPGGKLFFYTGLLDYLDDGASLAGVMAHEMAHADRRHSTRQMTNQYGFSILLSVITSGDATQLESILGDLALGLGALQFSQAFEYEADKYSMYYLAQTESNYYPKGISSFFVKMMEEDTPSNRINWLRTHPSDDKRVANVEEIWSSDKDFLSLRNNKTEADYDKGINEYKAFLEMLP